MTIEEIIDLIHDELELVVVDLDKTHAGLELGCDGAIVSKAELKEKLEAL